MKREIKFRAWYKDKMQYQDNKTPEWIGDILTDTEYYNPMQYTGLKDRNGKEIYEGDVLEIDGRGEIRPKAEVIFMEGCYCIKWSVNSMYPELKYYASNPVQSFVTCEIIGNIYENPELIKETAPR